MIDEAGRFYNPNPQYLEKDCGYHTPCWVWNWSVKPSGYGRYKNTQAHRYYYEKYVGLVPDEHQIDHLCQNRVCVNPEHLEAVSPYVNTDRSRASKIKDSDAEDILRLYATGQHSQKEIGEMYGCNGRTVSNLVSGVTKKHLDPLRVELFGGGKLEKIRDKVSRRSGQHFNSGNTYKRDFSNKT